MPAAPASRIAANGQSVTNRRDSNEVTPEAVALIEGKTIRKDPEAGHPEFDTKARWPLLTSICKELAKQGQLAVPLGLNLLANFSTSTISLKFIAPLGNANIAAASLATSTYWMFGKLLVQSLCGALDTRASQAYGMGAYEALPVIFQRTCMVMLAHCLPITLVQLAIPELLRLAGEDPDLCRLASAYAIRLLPSLYIEALSRPLNRILIAQRVALPQMFVSIAVAALHFGVNHLLVNTLGLGFLGAAWAIVIASFNTTALTALWVAVSGMQDRVWGKPTWQAFQRWGEFTKLAYSSCFMKVAESWAFGMLVLFAGLLPDPARSVASTSIAFNTYGITYMPFLAESIAVSTRVGNELGAGRPRQARMAVLATLSITPLLWAIIACIMAEPHLQALLLHLYVDGSDAVLWRTLCQLLTIVAAIELADAFQTVLGGVVQGSGRQQKGAVINLVAFYIFAMPLALFLAFYAGWGVLGLFAGMGLGPVVQTVLYGWLVLRTDWEKEALKAATLASKEEEEILVRQSLDIPRHSMHGAREPLLAGAVLDSSSGHNGQRGDLSGQNGVQVHNSGPEEGHAETCCRGGPEPHPGAASNLTYEVVAECGAEPPDDKVDCAR